MERFFLIIGILWLFGSSYPAQADQSDPALGGLFSELQSTDDPEAAHRLEGEIWEIWTRRGVEEVDKMMAYALQAMNAGAFTTSVNLFNQIIATAPDYAEAWNKRATVYYMMGRFEDSVRDIQQTLALEPRHFGALSGMGLIYDAIGNPQAAATVWEQALTIHPHMSGIRSRLEEILKQLKGRKI